MALLAAIAVPDPTSTLWAIWTKLSIFTLFPMIVLPTEPRSIVVFDPSYTSSPIKTFPMCCILTHSPLSLAKPNPSEPITTPA